MALRIIEVNNPIFIHAIGEIIGIGRQSGKQPPRDYVIQRLGPDSELFLVLPRRQLYRPDPFQGVQTVKDMPDFYCWLWHVRFRPVSQASVYFGVGLVP